jgi:L-asparaginase
MKLALFVTGGTFDKTYNELNGELSFKKTHVNEMLTLARSLAPVRVKTLMMIDSLVMTDEHREEIAKSCVSAKEKHIVITHGTDTMEQTARYLAPRLAKAGKTVVLTGAMVPYKFGSSDGLFNLGSAMAYAQVLPAGVYIAMNGRYFEWNNVRKNRSVGVFEERKS